MFSVSWPHDGGHDTENIYNDMYTRTRNVILSKHRLQLPDDGLRKPKHVGAILRCVIPVVLGQ